MSITGMDSPQRREERKGTQRRERIEAKRRDAEFAEECAE
jgi:hypothetical protein